MGAIVSHAPYVASLCSGSSMRRTSATTARVVRQPARSSRIARYRAFCTIAIRGRSTTADASTMKRESAPIERQRFVPGAADGDAPRLRAALVLRADDVLAVG